MEKEKFRCTARRGGHAGSQGHGLPIGKEKFRPRIALRGVMGGVLILDSGSESAVEGEIPFHVGSSVMRGEAGVLRVATSACGSLVGLRQPDDFGASVGTWRIRPQVVFVPGHDHAV